MAGETPITVVGNVCNDMELRFTQSGAAVISFTVASTPRKFDKNTNQWADGEPLFLRCNAWRQLAENIANSCAKGDRLIVTGNLEQRSFETREGEKRTVMELRVEEVGASMKFREVEVKRVQRQQGRPQDQQAGTAGYSGSDDPWGQPPPGQRPPQGRSGGDPWDVPLNDPPPFHHNPQIDVLSF